VVEATTTAHIVTATPAGVHQRLIHPCRVGMDTTAMPRPVRLEAGTDLVAQMGLVVVVLQAQVQEAAAVALVSRVFTLIRRRLEDTSGCLVIIRGVVDLLHLQEVEEDEGSERRLVKEVVEGVVEGCTAIREVVAEAEACILGRGVGMRVGKGVLFLISWVSFVVLHQSTAKRLQTGPDVR
jgi:hypothetical protein